MSAVCNQCGANSAMYVGMICDSCSTANRCDEKIAEPLRAEVAALTARVEKAEAALAEVTRRPIRTDPGEADLPPDPCHFPCSELTSAQDREALLVAVVGAAKRLMQKRSSVNTVNGGDVAVEFVDPSRCLCGCDPDAESLQAALSALEGK